MPDLRVEPATPAGFAWRDRALIPPALSQTPSVAITQWDASCADATCATTFVAACFRSTASTTSAEVDDLVHQKLIEVAAATAARAGHEVALARAAASESGPVTTRDFTGESAVARTLTGFATDGANMHACFALCAAPAGTTAACADHVHHAHISGEIGPRPAPSLALRSILAAVHHPRPAAIGVVALGAALALAAIATRPRPPRRPRAIR